MTQPLLLATGRQPGTFSESLKNLYKPYKTLYKREERRETIGERKRERERERRRGRGGRERERETETERGGEREGWREKREGTERKRERERERERQRAREREREPAAASMHVISLFRLGFSGFEKSAIADIVCFGHQ